MSNTSPVVGSATIGPCSLLNVPPPVVCPWPAIGSPLLCHVAPSSVDFLTWISVLLPESWYETQTVFPSDVIHCRSACVLSSTAVVQSPGPAAALGQFVTETPS